MPRITSPEAAEAISARMVFGPVGERGLGDLFLSSGRPANAPEVQALVGSVLKATKEAGILSGIAAGTPAEARSYLAMGYSRVMVSNDATLFGRTAAELVSAARCDQGTGGVFGAAR